MKILHVLESSIPQYGGYTIRARSIVDYQRRIGLEPVVVTSPFFPAKDRAIRIENHEGVRYYRTNFIASPTGISNKIAAYAVRVLMMARYRRAVLEVALRERPDVIHAHSSYSNAYAGLAAARPLGLPMVYEVRTLWGESAVVEDGLKPDSWKHKAVWQLELNAMRRVDMVVPIARGIRDELARRGIPEEKLAIVPNGVDSGRFMPVPRDEARAKAIGLADCFVIGFIGSIRRLEGLGTLLSAYGLLRRKRERIGLVIVGDGPDLKALEAQAREMGLAGVVFAGNVPHADIASWYSILDVLVYPRLKAVINERVTPLKPLEAMALGKVCVGSNVGGLMELIRNDDNGVIFDAGNPTALAAALLGLMDDPGRRRRLVAAGINYVRNERDWMSIIPRYREIYDNLLAKKGGGWIPAARMRGATGGD
jgi:PEP-CTERM/exosortase A-associated glycosyltransferase